ncbi:hypothetical protein VTP01DRAFT_5166 [Rhizomucor pusillus]|uniref:uncharacterized protein n=1 Tax=Rhizomucor pusillus TaxID=4840 RepID=UPI003742901E
MRDKCARSLTKTRVYKEQHDSKRIIEERAQSVSRWIEDGIIFRENRVLIDESGFRMNMVRSRAWSKKGTLATVKVPTQRGPTYVTPPNERTPFAELCDTRFKYFSACTNLLSFIWCEKQYLRCGYFYHTRGIPTTSIRPCPYNYNQYHLKVFAGSRRDKVCDKQLFALLNHTRVHML